MDVIYVGRANASHERETCKDDRNCRGKIICDQGQQNWLQLGQLMDSVG